MNIKIPDDIQKGFKIACARQGKTMTDVVTNFLIKYTELTNQQLEK